MILPVSEMSWFISMNTGKSFEFILHCDKNHLHDFIKVNSPKEAF